MAGILGGLTHALTSNLGNSTDLTQKEAGGTPALTAYAGWAFPKIPYGTPTTIIPVAFPLTSTPEPLADRVVQHWQIVGVCAAAMLIAIMPLFCVNKGCCCAPIRVCFSRHTGCLFCIGLLASFTFCAVVVNAMPGLTVNNLFYDFVAFVAKFTDQLEQVLTQVSIVGVVGVAFVFRKRILALLGFQHQVVRADMRDILTFFTMNRFRAVELAVWKVADLPAGFNSRSVYLRVILGYNEPLHSRPHDGVTTSLLFRERIQLNYDPEDDTQKLAIIIKEQEIVGSAVAQIMPAAGAIVGAIGGLTSIGPAPGAAMGVVTGIGAANSLGKEVARVDLSAAMINRFRKAADGDSHKRATTTSVSGLWATDNFMKVDLVPQGYCWLRISDIVEDDV